MASKVFAVTAGVVLCGVALAAGSAKPTAKVVISSSRADGLCQTGDPVEFVVKVSNPDGTPATNGTIEVRRDKSLKEHHLTR